MKYKELICVQMSIDVKVYLKLVIVLFRIGSESLRSQFIT